MRILYLDCSMGIAGDMLVASLIDLLEDKQVFFDKIKKLGLKGIDVEYRDVLVSGVSGHRFKVLIDGVEEKSVDVGEYSHSHEHIGHGHNHSHEHEHEDCVVYEHAHSHEHLAHGHNHSHEHEHEECVAHVHEHSNEYGEHVHTDSHTHGKHEHNHSHEHEHEDCVAHVHEHSHTDEAHSHAHSHPHNHLHTSTHSHNSLRDIETILQSLNVSEKVKSDARAIYKIIAEAESKVHSVDVHKIHFHEVGDLDAIVDIVSVCILIDLLKVEKIYASKINVGSGFVKCAHGILPVPAPATSLILKNIPIYSDEIKAELCTPTGAAILKYFVSKFMPMPELSIEKISYGMGTKEFEKLNCVRAFLANQEQKTDIVELACTVDDMTGEELSFAMDKLFENFALDVYIQDVYMKKSRPAHIITVLAKDIDKEKIIQAIYKYTSTLGIREYPIIRHSLDRKIENVDTEFGSIKRKISYSKDFDIKKEKWEYEDLARLANENNLSLQELKEKLNK